MIDGDTETQLSLNVSGSCSETLIKVKHPFSLHVYKLVKQLSVESLSNTHLIFSCIKMSFISVVQPSKTYICISCYCVGDLNMHKNQFRLDTLQATRAQSSAFMWVTIKKVWKQKWNNVYIFIFIINGFKHLWSS